MIRMVVTSFYNTLINEEEAISTKTMLEIDRIRQNKCLFTINTNRSYKEVKDYNKSFPFIDYIISLNGNYIYDVNKNKCIFKSKLTSSNINKITSIFKDDEIVFYKEDNDIYKIEVKSNDKEKINKLLELKLEVSYFNDYIEITKNNSYVGLTKLINKLGINDSEVLVICCNDSDKSLINNIKNNYLVKNSKLKKNKYTKITSSNEEEGVRKVLKEV